MKLNINGVTVEVDITTLSKAIEDKKETFDIKSDDIVLRTKDAQESFENNIKSESQKIGEEMGRKDVFKSLEIDIEGTGAHKTSEKSAEALKTWSGEAVTTAVKDAGIDPDKKLDVANEDIRLLRENLSTANNSVTAWETKHNTHLKQSGIRKDIVKSLASETLAFPIEDVVDLMLLRNKFDQDENGNTFQVGQDGNPMKDADRNVLPLSSSMTSFFDKNSTYRQSAGGGAGGGDSTGGDKLQTFAEFDAEMVSKGDHPLNGDSYRGEMSKRQEAGTLEQ